MDEVTKAAKRLAKKTISAVAGTQIELTYSRTNLVKLTWDGEDIEVFNRLQELFGSELFDYWYDADWGISVCCLSI